MHIDVTAVIINSVALSKTGGRGGVVGWIGEEREGREKGVGREGRKERERETETQKERQTDRHI